MSLFPFADSARRADQRFEPLGFLRQFERQAPRFAFSAKNRHEWQQWRRGFRAALATTIGLDQMPRCRLRANEGPVEQCDGYDRKSLAIETAPGLWVPAFLLVPHGSTRPRPAIVCCHGHGTGMNGLAGLTEDGRPRRVGGGYQHDFAIQAVRAGFVALTYDQCGFGRRRDFAFNRAQGLTNACEQPSKNALHWGLTMTGIRVWDARRMVDLLQARPEVARRRIGMVGISGGGLVAQFAAALDDRVRAAGVSGYCNRFADCILAIRHCIDNYVPGLGRLADSGDIAALIAPRPLLIQAGTRDPLFPIAATRSAVRMLARCYALLGAGRSLETDIFAGGHQFRGRPFWAFFHRHLA
jgi:dienelactone hydrolase